MRANDDFSGKISREIGCTPGHQTQARAGADFKDLGRWPVEIVLASGGETLHFRPTMHLTLFRLLLPTLLCGMLRAELPRLKVSDNHRFLVTEAGAPFFYLGDTAWELFHRLTREEASLYLEDRARKGFTVIQAVALAEFDGLHEPNAYGDSPLLHDDPTQPDVKEGAANDYWDHVDFIVRRANALGLYVGFLPTWGDKWNKKRGQGPEVFSPQNAETYGAWLGRRYKDAGLLWILGGDRPIESDTHREILRALARGLRAGDGGAHLITFHPNGGHGSAEWFHEEDWLDFNLRQNGHIAEFTGRYDRTHVDYERMPPKPVLDGEPLYEGHPVSFKAAEFGYSVAADVRRALYWDLFSGACGHTYGHHSIWQFAREVGAKGHNNPILTWQEALKEPGAAQMQWGRKLIESRPILTRVPDDSLIVPGPVAAVRPGAGTRRFVATRDSAGSYAMIYAPVCRAFTVKLDGIGAGNVRAWWFNPRDGSAWQIGEYPAKGVRKFTPPNPGELLDWVLVLDDVAKSYPPPGQSAPAFAKIESFFRPPPEFAGQLGSYPSPLRFYDGRPVKDAADWPARRQEILDKWHGLMGPWPPLIERPRMERIESIRRDNFTQHRIRIEVAPGMILAGYLLVPDGAGPFPAVVVPFYDAETSVGLKNELRDFALQLSRRGFVSLAIGSPGGDACKPDLGTAHCQPLSFLGYIAANCYHALAALPEVDAKRVGIVGHSYGGKWSMFGSCLYEKFACAVWSDPGIVFDEARGSVNYWEPWYLGLEPGRTRKPGLITPESPRTGAYAKMIAEGRDLLELHALMAPRPFLVSGGSEDSPARWVALNHAVAVNELLGFRDRVAMTNRVAHPPTAESNEQIYVFFERVLQPSKH